MADTLFDATLETARRLGIVKSSIATTGTSTTVVDTVSRLEEDDYWNEGTIWITEDAGGESAAPEGQYSKISDFDQTSATATIKTLTAAVAANDAYAIGQPKYPLDLLISSVNTVLTGIYVPVWNSTALDTASNQTEYTLPTTIFRGNLLEVGIQTRTGDADDNRVQRIEKWHIRESAAGTGDTLILPQLTPSRDIWLKYKVRHPLLDDYDDKINEFVIFSSLATHAAAECVFSRIHSGAETNKFAGEIYNRLAAEADEMPLTRYPLGKPDRFRTISKPRKTKYTGEVGAVRLGD
jgi:hypothetical protein